METKITIKIENIPDWTTYIRESYARLKSVFEFIGQRILGASQHLSPVDTGYMKSQHSQEIEDNLNDPRLQQIASVLKVDTDYAAYVFYGHSTCSGGWVEGQPWILDAILPQQNIIKNLIMSAFLDTRVKYISTPGGAVASEFGFPTKGSLTAGH